MQEIFSERKLKRFFIFFAAVLSENENVLFCLTRGEHPSESIKFYDFFSSRFFSIVPSFSYMEISFEAHFGE